MKCGRLAGPFRTLMALRQGEGEAKTGFPKKILGPKGIFHAYKCQAPRIPNLIFNAQHYLHGFSLGNKHLGNTQINKYTDRQIS